MKTNFSISIENPCSKKFNQFEKTTAGGFCNSCKKKVIDFRNMSDDLVLQHLQNENETICGYFKSSQLHKTMVMKTQQQTVTTFVKVAAITIFSLLAFQNVQAQDTKTVEVEQKDTAQDKYLKGEVKDESGPLAGASILLKGTKVGVTADFDGKFTFPKVLKEGDVLLVSYIGFETQKFVIAKDQKFLSVELTQDDIDLLGAVQVKKVYSSTGN
ncbi:MAG: carboxypeptidase-like regulatory domain-containing protein [Jejuia sp.]